MSETPFPAGQPTALVSFRQVVKRFGDVLALDCVSLDIREGEFFTLLGPSGCGKTTLMRLVAGFEEPDSGEVLLDGKSLAGVPPHRRPVNMMFQSYALFPHMNVGANIGFGLREQGVPKSEREARVTDMLKLVRLEGLGDRRPDQLSGGQRQRVALARALVLKPRLLLLDEPMAALDRKLREETQRELKRIQTELGTTFVIVTHDQDEAMALSDRVAVLSAGRVRQIGSPADIYEQPADRFVAGFVGDASFLICEVSGRDGDHWRLRHGATGTEFRCSGRRACRPGERLTLMLRPERLSFGAPGTAPAGLNSLSGVLRDRTYRGDHSVYAIDVSGGEVITVSHDGRAGQGVYVPRPGDTVAVWFAAGDGVLLAGEGP